MHRFLALLNFYHRFLPNADAVQAELHDQKKSAVKKDATLITRTVSLAALFETCKNMISQAVLLFYPIEGTQWSLQVDASECSIGACLQHASSDGKLPLSFFPRKLKQAESKYSAFDRELLALYSSVLHFQLMLE
ncbi:transposon Tf2-8 polyprotein [Trichonephila clavata]|uniref:Transposon Tf2-8 polyprotein n=1 Tax=Trichonephila clavata TaxID=2740835 RepID=A0A8X6LYP7_TRICU|nr:transposon Tf2-8 polyprotein [Trichonephila clavata]